MIAVPLEHPPLPVTPCAAGRCRAPRALTAGLCLLLALAAPGPARAAPVAPLPPASAQPTGGLLSVVDAMSGTLHVIDLDRALRDGHAENAVLVQVRLRDEQGRPMVAEPLGIAGVWDTIYVSFRDGSLLEYAFPAGPAAMADPEYHRQGVAVRRVQLPRVATRLAWQGDTLAYISLPSSDIGALGTVYLLDTVTLAEKGQVRLADLATEPPGATGAGAPDARAPGSRVGESHAYEIAGLSLVPNAFRVQDVTYETVPGELPAAGWADLRAEGVSGLAVLMTDPQALLVAQTRDGRRQITAEYPVPLGPASQVYPADLALATGFLPQSEHPAALRRYFHLIRRGREVQVLQQEAAYHARTFLARPLEDGAVRLERQDASFTLEWRPQPMQSSAICFPADFPGDRAVLFARPRPLYAAAERARYAGWSFPFTISDLSTLDPLTAPPEAIGGAGVGGRAGAARLATYPSDHPAPPTRTVPVELPIAPRGCFKAVGGPVPAGPDEYVPAISLGEEFPLYFGTDAATGGRYLGNFRLRPALGRAAFALPAAATTPRGIDVRLTGKWTRIHGQVSTFGDYGRIIPLPDAQVTVSLWDGQETLITHTDASGEYQVLAAALQPDLAVAVTAELRDRFGVVAVQSDREFNGGTVRAVTRPSRVRTSPHREDVVFGPGFQRLDPSQSYARREVMRDGAVIYYHAQQASRLARETLGLHLDHRLPVDIRIHTADDIDFYDRTRSDIRIPHEDAGGLPESVPHSLQAPDNREYHEFGHHVHADAALGGENAIPPRPPGDQNHGGVQNSTSQDSFTEGFAEFFALLVKGEPRYRLDGTYFDLQRNFIEEAPGVPLEEFNVAALLWDLVDSDGEADDRLSIPVRELWQLMQSPQITTVRSLYLALKPRYGNRNTGPADGLADLDALFVAHRFFADQNGNGAWDQGEAVGYADWYQSRAASGSPRPRRPPLPGTLLTFAALDPAGAPLAVPRLEVKTRFADPGRDTRYEVNTSSAGGRLRVYVPPDSQGVELQPLLPGYRTQPLMLAPGDFWAEVIAARQAGREVFRTHTFRLAPGAVPAPQQLVAVPVAADGVRLNWTIPAGVAEVALLRGVGAPPAGLSDGELLLRGSGTAFDDTGLISGLTYHYSLFGLRVGELSRPATAAVTPGVASEPEGGAPLPPAPPPPLAAPPAPGGLRDTAGHWAAAPIQAALDRGYVSGFPDGTFQPDRTLSRAEFIKMLAGARGLRPQPQSTSPVPAPGHWVVYLGWLQAAVAAGIVDPGDYPQGFAPDGAIARQEIALLAMRAAGVIAAAAATAPAPDFADAADIAAGARGFVSRAVAAGVVSGFPDRTFRPADPATRAQAVVIIQRLLGLP